MIVCYILIKITEYAQPKTKTGQRVDETISNLSSILFIIAFILLGARFVATDIWNAKDAITELVKWFVVGK